MLHFAYTTLLIGLDGDTHWHWQAAGSLILVVLVVVLGSESYYYVLVLPVVQLEDHDGVFKFPTRTSP